MDDGKPDLAAVLRHYGVDVPPHRQNLLVCCPVHQEDRPSCSVSLTKNLYSCKACGSQGDAFTLICAKEGIGFREAVEFAREHFGTQPGGMEAGRRNPGKGSRRGFRPVTKRRGLAG